MTTRTNDEVRLRRTTDDLAVLRRCWHAVAFAEDVAPGPLHRQVLDVDLVLWQGSNGVVAAKDRCPYRSTQLSAGCVVDGDIQWPYHGWRFGSGGGASHIPQLRVGLPVPPAAPARDGADGHRGWTVNLVIEGPPLTPEPSSRVPRGARWTRMADEAWQCSALRVVENGLDPAHVDFVHAGTFGGAGDPVDHRPTIERDGHRLVLRSSMPVRNQEGLAGLTGSGESVLTRSIETEYVPALSRVFTIDDGDGVIQSIFQAATPLGAGSCRVLQWCWRNDREDHVAAADVVAWDQRVLDEDRAVLERTASDFELDPADVVSLAYDPPHRGATPGARRSGAQLRT